MSTTHQVLFRTDNFGRDLHNKWKSFDPRQWKNIYKLIDALIVTKKNEKYSNVIKDWMYLCLIRSNDNENNVYGIKDWYSWCHDASIEPVDAINEWRKIISEMNGNDAFYAAMGLVQWVAHGNEQPCQELIDLFRECAGIDWSLTFVAHS